jgi:benzoyl-CoA reductase subunit C
MDPLEKIFKESEDIIRDIEFKKIRAMKEKENRKVFAYFPVYVPMEILHALDIIPLGLHGAGNEIEILHADSRFGSFICSIVKSTMELGLSNRLDFIDGMLYTGICDAARNVSYIYKRSFPEKEIIFFHLPQNPESAAAVEFLIKEYESLIQQLEKISGTTFNEEKFKKSIRLYNENRRLQRELYHIRRDQPGVLKTSELYAAVRVGNFISVEEHNQLMGDVLRLIADRPVIQRDRIRVIVEGSFCEQPPLELLKLLDEMGSHIIDDDFVLGRRLILDDVNPDGDAMRSLADAYLNNTPYTSVKYSGKTPKSKQFIDKIKLHAPEAVIFMYAKFCEPGLFDYVLFKRELEAAGIPYLFIEFEEKMWNFDRMRLEIETFFESLIFA